MNVTRLILSGSSDGQMIPVAATATPGTLIHTAVANTSGAGTIDELHLWVSNVTGGAATLTIEWGGTTSTADLMTAAYSVAANSAPVKIVDGQVLQGGLVIRAFSGTANALNISGYVNRIARTIYAQKVGGPS